MSDLREALENLITAATQMPRQTPAPGGAATLHKFMLSAAAVWALDKALNDARAALSAQSQPEAVEADLTCDFAQALPGGKLDDSTYGKIEDALDKIEAPAQDANGKWLSLHERIAALSASPLAPDARMRRVLERIRDDGPDHGVRWCRNIASEALRADEGKEPEGDPRASQWLPKASQELYFKHDWCPTCHRGWEFKPKPSDPTPAEQWEAIARCLVLHDPNYKIYHMPGETPRKWKAPSGGVFDTSELSEDCAESVRVRADLILALSTRAGG